MIRSVFNSTLFSGFASILAYSITIVMARNDSQIAFAEFTYATVWGLILTQLVDLASVQCVTHFKTSSKISLDTIISSIYRAKLVVMLAVLVILFFLNLVLGFEVPFLFLFFMVPAFFLGPIFEIKSKNVAFARILFFEKASMLIFVYFYLKYNPFDIIIYLSYFFISLFSLAYQVKYLNLDMRIFRRFEHGTLVDYFLRYWPIYITLGTQITYGHISRIIIEDRLGIITFVSVSLALQIVNALNVIQTQVDRHIRPTLISVIDSKNIRDFFDVSVKYVVVYLAPLSCGCIVLYLFSSEVILFLFGEQWGGAASNLRYLVPLIVSVAAMRYLDIIVVALNMGRINLYVNVFVAGILIILLLMIPDGNPVEDYLFAIVGVQIFHIATIVLCVLNKIYSIDWS